MSTRTQRTFTGPNQTGKQQLNFLPEIVRRDLRVVRVETITPKYRRIVLSGADLEEGFPFVHFACNDHVKVYFPDPKIHRIVSYRLTDHNEWEIDSDVGSVYRRDYTPRAYDDATHELTLDFVIHEHGVAGIWARDAQIGDDLVVMGPRANWLLPENYPQYLTAGDETALPAISRLIEEAPAGSHVTAIIEIADADERQHLSPGPDVSLDLRWIQRDTTHVQEGHLSLLETAIRSVQLPQDLDELYVFAAGEAGAMKPIRRYLRHEVGIPKDQIAIDGYWKRGIADHDHHSNDFSDDD